MSPGDRRVLHVLHTWGVGSHTFIRSTIGHTPAPATVLCRQREVGATTSGAGTRPRVVAIGGITARAPRRWAGRVGVVAGLAVAVAHRTRVVHAHFAHELPLAHRLARALRCPLVVSLHGRDLLVELPRHAAGRAALGDAAAVIVPSTFLAAEAEAFGVDASRLAVVPSGVDLSERPPPGGDEATAAGPVRVLFVGRFVAKKGPVDAVRAVAAARDRGVDVAARFMGSGPLYDEVVAAAAPLGDRAEVVDGSDRAAVWAALAAADIVLTPSRTAPDGDRETLLMVNLEAQACGVPVITTRHGGIADGLAPGAAITVPEGDGPALTDALVALALDPTRRRRMGRRGRRWVEAERTAARAGARTAAVYDTVTRGRPLPSELRP